MTQRDDGLDIGYLSDDPEGEPKPPRSGEVIAKGALGRDFYSKPKSNRSSGKTMGGVERGMRQMSMLPVPQLRKTDMATVDIKCNYAKDRNVVIGGLILTFDKNGICKMPVSQMAQLQVVMRARPGRFVVVKAAVPTAPKVVEVASVVEEAPEIEIEEVVETTTEESKEVAEMAAEESEEVKVEEAVDEIAVESSPLFGDPFNFFEKD